MTRRFETSDEGSSKSVSFADAAGSMSSLTSAAATSMEVAPTPPYSLKRKASSTLSALLRRLSQGWNSADEEDNEAEEPVTPRSFSMRLRKVMRIIGLSNSNSDDQPQLPAEPGLAPAQPSPAVASLSQCSGINVDDLSELSLDELVDKAFPPLSPHPRTLTLALTLALTLTLTHP